MSMKKGRRRAHYCWCCGDVRPNERFSGRGHSRHLCKECEKLGPEELAFRQHVRNIDRLLTPSGAIRRKGRKALDRFLNHEDERVRRHAQDVFAAAERWQAERLSDESLEDFACGEDSMYAEPADEDEWAKSVDVEQLEGWLNAELSDEDQWAPSVVTDASFDFGFNVSGFGEVEGEVAAVGPREWDDDAIPF